MSAALATTFPSIDPDITARLIDELLATIPRAAQGGGDAVGADTAVIAETDALHPRDLEETLLATQIVALHHSAMRCLQAAAQHEVASKEASRLRRDALAQHRMLLATIRALHKSQTRPMQEDPETLVPRPTVPAARPARPRPPVRPVREPGPEDRKGPAPAATPNRAPPVAAAQDPRFVRDLLAGKPELQALRDKWDTLPDWRTMTMEQRRATWGYKWPPEQASNATRNGTDPGNG